MKQITIKLIFSLLLLIEFYPIEAESKCSFSENTNPVNITEGIPVNTIADRAKAVNVELIKDVRRNLMLLNEGKVNMAVNDSEWEITKAMILDCTKD